MDNLVKKTADLKVDARKTRSGRIFEPQFPPQVGNKMYMACVYLVRVDGRPEVDASLTLRSLTVPTKPRSPAMCPEEVQSQCTQIVV